MKCTLTYYSRPGALVKQAGCVGYKTGDLKAQQWRAWQSYSRIWLFGGDGSSVLDGKCTEELQHTEYTLWHTF